MCVCVRACVRVCVRVRVCVCVCVRACVCVHGSILHLLLSLICFFVGVTVLTAHCRRHNGAENRTHPTTLSQDKRTASN